LISFQSKKWPSTLNYQGSNLRKLENLSCQTLTSSYSEEEEFSDWSNEIFIQNEFKHESLSPEKKFLNPLKIDSNLNNCTENNKLSDVIDKKENSDLKISLPITKEKTNKSKLNEKKQTGTAMVKKNKMKQKEIKVNRSNTMVSPMNTSVNNSISGNKKFQDKSKVSLDKSNIKQSSINNQIRTKFIENSGKKEFNNAGHRPSDISLNPNEKSESEDTIIPPIKVIISTEAKQELTKKPSNLKSNSITH
jgi:hypothetical protein